MIRILIIDDEPPAQARMKRLLDPFPDCEVVGEAGSGRRALELIPALRPDLLLLDISMPGIDGMALARTLQELDDAPAVVFCTAWPDQALEAFDCDAVDYLVKPVRPERLQAAILKVRRLLNLAAEAATSKQYLRSTVGGKTTLVALNDVICLVAEDKYTTVIHEQGKAVINDSLVELEKRFPALWIRVHRNALVAHKRIRGMQRSPSGPSSLLLDGTGYMPEISRRKLSAIRRYIRELA